LRISYHAWKAYKECPKKFYLEFFKRAKPTVPPNDYHRLYGVVVQKFFEMFCNIWRFKTPHLFPEVIEERLELLWESTLISNEVNWSAPHQLSKKELFDKALKDICAIMGSTGQNYFLNTQSEVSIELKLKTQHVLTGRLDFVHADYLAGNSTVIFDGKGTDKIGKNIDNNQLYFYALLYYLSSSKIPDTLGIFYYQLNSFIPIFFNLEILNEFRAKLSLDIKEMTGRESFTATPCAKSCKYCKYIIGCQEGTESKAKRARKSKLSDIDGEGVIELVF